MVKKAASFIRNLLSSTMNGKKGDFIALAVNFLNSRAQRITIGARGLSCERASVRKLWFLFAAPMAV
jgi:hypothetical protein